MDQLLVAAFDEIALQGSSGITFGQLWKFIEDTKTVPQVDDFIQVHQEFIWSHVRTRTDIEVWIVQPSTPPSYASVASIRNPETRGYNSFSNRQLLSADESLKTVRELLAKYKDTVRLVASQAARYKALGVLTPVIAKGMTEWQYIILEEIGRSRSTGAKQTELSKRVEMPPKNLFHHLKKLLSMGLLCKSDVLDLSSMPAVRTNLLRLQRYASVELPFESSASNEQVNAIDNRKLLSQITAFLASAPQKVLPELSVKVQFSLVGKKNRGNSTVRWSTIKRRLVTGGYIEEFDANVEGKATTCLRFLKHFQEKERTAGEASGDEVEEDDHLVDAGAGGLHFNRFCSELPLDYQLFSLIHARGSDGITQGELYHETGLDRKVLVKRTSVLQSAYGVVAVPVTVNRQMTYRLFTPQNYQPDNLLSQAQNLVRQAVAEREETKAVVKEKENLDRQEAEDDESKEPSDRPKRVRPLTMLYVRRKEAALRVLEQQKVMLQNDLRHHLGTEEGGAALDLKTVRRLVQLLISEGLALHLEVAVPMLRGAPRIHEALMLPALSAEHPTVQSFIAQVRAAEPKISAPKVKPEVETLPELHIELPSRDARHPPESNDHVSVALRYGFVRAVMIRAKLLHQFLWERVFGTDLSSTGRFLLLDVVNDMRLQLYLQVIGYTRASEQLDLCVNEDRLMRDIPLQLRSEMFAKRVPERRFRFLLDILHRLQLVDFAPSDNSADLLSSSGAEARAPPSTQNFMGQLVLRKIVTIADPHDSASEPRVFELDDVAKLMAYWSQLETYACAASEETPESADAPPESFDVGSTRTTAGISKRESAASFLDVVPEAAVPRNWALVAVMSPAQRKLILDQLWNDSDPSKTKVAEVARLVGLSSYQVQRFLQEEHDRDQRRQYYRRYKRRAESQLDTNVEDAAPEQELNADGVLSFRFKQPIVPDMPAHTAAPVQYVVPTDQAADLKPKTRTKRARRAAASNDDPAPSSAPLQEETPEVEEGEEELQSVLSPVAGAVPLRPVWTDQEDIQLLRQYAARCANGKVDWASVASFLRKHPLSCQRRFKKLMEFPHCRQVLEVALKATGKPSPSDVLLSDADLLVMLPQSIDAFWMKYQTAAREGMTELTPRHRLIQQILLAILATPDDLYQPEAAARLLRSFEETEQNEVINYLRLRGILARSRQRSSIRSHQLSREWQRTSKDRRVPTNLLSDCIEYAKQHQALQEWCISPFSSSGAALFALENAAFDRMSLEPRLIPGAHEEQHSALRGKLRGLLGGRDENDLKLPAWEVHLTCKEKPLVEFSLQTASPQLYQVVRSVTAFSTADALSCVQKAPLAEAALALYQRIVSGAEMGVASSEIQALERPHLELLHQNTLVFRVCCWDHSRWIARSFIHFWCVPITRLGSQDHDAVVVRIWTLLNGELNASLLSDLRLKLLTSILAQPGILESALINDMQPILGPEDVRDLLAELVDRRILQQTKVDVSSAALFATSGSERENTYQLTVLSALC